jgi:hypothetical protein
MAPRRQERRRNPVRESPLEQAHRGRRWSDGLGHGGSPSGRFYAFGFLRSKSCPPRKAFARENGDRTASVTASSSRVLPAVKSIAGGSRARGRQPRIVKTGVYTVNTLTRRLTGLTRLTLGQRGLTDTVLKPERGIVRFANFRFWRLSLPKS